CFKLIKIKTNSRIQKDTVRHVNRPQNTITEEGRITEIKNQVIPKDNTDPPSRRQVAGKSKIYDKHA
ncbi:MAG: hypothetical protein QW566_02585, partial [Candidatus Jordarchaeales archaeon]